MLKVQGGYVWLQDLHSSLLQACSMTKIRALQVPPVSTITGQKHERGRRQIGRAGLPVRGNQANDTNPCLGAVPFVPGFIIAQVSSQNCQHTRREFLRFLIVPVVHQSIRHDDILIYPDWATPLTTSAIKMLTRTHKHNEQTLDPPQHERKSHTVSAMATTGTYIRIWLDHVLVGVSGILRTRASKSKPVAKTSRAMDQILKVFQSLLGVQSIA